MRLRELRPSPAMVVAIIALVFALGGSGMAASKVLFARNADRVDTIHASRTPKPGRLLPLDAKGKLPASVLTSAQPPKGDTGAQGSKGDTGAQGSKGDTGATGAPGPTASSYAHSTGGSTIAGTGGGTTVIDLVSVPNTGSMEAHRGAITVSYNARLIATGTLALRNANATAEGTYCWLVLDPQVSGGTSFYYWGVAISMAPTTYANPLSVTDGIDVGPGTYNVGVRCWAYGMPGISVQAADLTVIATAR